MLNFQHRLRRQHQGRSPAHPRLSATMFAWNCQTVAFPDLASPSSRRHRATHTKTTLWSNVAKSYQHRHAELCAEFRRAETSRDGIMLSLYRGVQSKPKQHMSYQFVLNNHARIAGLRGLRNSRI